MCVAAGGHWGGLCGQELVGECVRFLKSYRLYSANQNIVSPATRSCPRLPGKEIKPFSSS